LKIALTTWGKRISPVFDFAKTLMIVDLENVKTSNRSFITFDPQNMNQMLYQLQNQRTDILICGAITDDRSIFFEQNGMVLIPFIFGNTDQILATLMNEKHRILDFRMAGVILNNFSSQKNFFYKIIKMRPERKRKYKFK